MNFLFRQVDIAALAFFRIVFGLLMCIDILNTLFYDHWYKDSLSSNQFHFYYYGFEWIKPLAGSALSILLIFLSIVALCIMVGKWYRLSCSIFALGFSYLFFLEKAHYLNHAYLVCWLSFLMILLPANRAFSLDVLKKPSLRLNTVPFWTLFLLQFMMGIVYFYGGIAKINPDWLQAMPLQIWLKDLSDMPILGKLLAQKWTAYFMSYGGLILDCFIVFFLVNSKTRIWALAAAIFFHSVNVILFNIGIFPFLSLSLTLLFFPPDFPRKIITYLNSRSNLFQKFSNYLAQAFEQLPPVEQSNLVPYKNLIPIAILVFCSFHLLLPLRHHLYDTNVAWTEEGHRYSWRMLLRSKKARGYFIVKNSQTKETVKINTRDYLSPKQRRKMLTHPDMILQFAHFLRDQYIEVEYWEEVEVYAFIKAKLNGREYQRYIDPEVDLAKEEWQFFHSSTWIVKLEK